MLIHTYSHPLQAPGWPVSSTRSSGRGVLTGRPAASVPWSYYPHLFTPLAGAGVAGFLDTFFWAWSADRQANRIRALYLASVLSQDIAFFDTSATGTGGLLQVLGFGAEGFRHLGHRHRGAAAGTRVWGGGFSTPQPPAQGGCCRY